ncbi:hypothetical protein B0H34DRAFT_432387 [Crassisporium funariophilum]|nr:hypothetical protein B0H34DRAFT_432387 [Crassisporium funariophilum]
MPTRLDTLNDFMLFEEVPRTTRLHMLKDFLSDRTRANFLYMNDKQFAITAHRCLQYIVQGMPDLDIQTSQANIRISETVELLGYYGWNAGCIRKIFSSLIIPLLKRAAESSELSDYLELPETRIVILGAFRTVKPSEKDALVAIESYILMS